jgi:hypothetical protein
MHAKICSQGLVTHFRQSTDHTLLAAVLFILKILVIVREIKYMKGK